MDDLHPSELWALLWEGEGRLRAEAKTPGCRPACCLHTARTQLRPQEFTGSESAGTCQEGPGAWLSYCLPAAQSRPCLGASDGTCVLGTDLPGAPLAPVCAWSRVLTMLGTDVWSAMDSWSGWGGGCGLCPSSRGPALGSGQKARPDCLTLSRWVSRVVGHGHPPPREAVNLPLSLVTSAVGTHWGAGVGVECGSLYLC